MKTPSQTGQVREILQREFIRRCKVNSAYSLRAFANYLEVDQSFLSKILNGKRKITPRFAADVIERLGISPQDLIPPSKDVQTAGNYLSLTAEEFEVLSYWIHFAIIELSKTSKFRYDPKAIASRFGIHQHEVTDAVDRLVKLKFIRLDAKKMIVLSRNTTWSDAKSTSVARQMFQRSLIQKSLEAIDEVPFDLRDNGSVTIAIDKGRLPEFKQKLISVRRELGEYFQPDKAKNLDEVYQLTISFFPLTKISGARN